MRSMRFFLVPGSVFLALLALVGCGYNGSAGGALPAFSPTASLVPGKTGSITLRVDKSFYLTTETITVTVRNQSSATISFADHQTNCTVILLQRQKAQPETSDRTSMDVSPCHVMTATRMHTLAAGHQLVVPLVAPKGGWPTGWFLATLSYRPFSPVNSSPTVSSPAFTIGPSSV